MLHVGTGQAKDEEMRHSQYSVLAERVLDFRANDANALEHICAHLERCSGGCPLTSGKLVNADNGTAQDRQ
jgi:hypothetical protein